MTSSACHSSQLLEFRDHPNAKHRIHATSQTVTSNESAASDRRRVASRPRRSTAAIRCSPRCWPKELAKGAKTTRCAVVKRRKPSCRSAGAGPPPPGVFRLLRVALSAGESGDGKVKGPGRNLVLQRLQRLNMRWEARFGSRWRGGQLRSDFFVYLALPGSHAGETRCLRPLPRQRRRQ
eukprot:s2106_g11.t1